MNETTGVTTESSAAASTGILKPLIDWLILGGPVVWILMALATIALMIILIKCWQFARAGVGRTRRVDQVLDDLHGNSDSEAALIRLREQSDPASRAVRVAVQGLRDGFEPDTVREEVRRVASDDLDRLHGYLRALGIIGTICPLLGLLGTVIGMISAFQGIELAGDRVDPAALSGGIWQALLTTAVGLAIAIPVALAHAWLERRLDRLASRIESLVAQVFTGRLQRAAGRA